MKLIIKNDYEAMEQAGEGGHKEINRTNLTLDQAEDALKRSIVLRQLELIKMRMRSPVFCQEAKKSLEVQDGKLFVEWNYQHQKARLLADFKDASIQIVITDNDREIFYFRNPE